MHRDIKPENILLHEGEAVVADFGIALALREAGGSRLTETGLSLGTPQYMSPEQATGDRALDARSDVYSLGAVLYEMLAGEPPVTGPTVQAVIAKLLTERPTRLRTVRDTVPDPIDAAVAKALAKVPADRFASAAEFAAALRTRGPAAALPSPRRPSRFLWVAVAGVAVLAALAGWFVKARPGRPGGPAVTLAGRTQLTFAGNVQAPTLSLDGKQLAYFTRTCREGVCTYAVDVQDVGGSTAHRIFDGFSAAYYLAWSPDRRNLLAISTLGGRTGMYLQSALGGTPRFLGAGFAAFYAGGDSLLLAPPAGLDSVFWVRVVSLGGVVADSIRVAGQGAGLLIVGVVPGSPWILTETAQGTHGLWQVMDRQGRVADRFLNACVCPGVAGPDALWIGQRSAAGPFTVVRMAFDPRSGHLARHQDTVLVGTMNNFSVTADGSAVAFDEGTFEYNTWAVDLADALKGRLPDSRRVLRASTALSASVSPDGSRLLVKRVLPSATGAPEQHLSVMPFGGGREVPLDVAGSVVAAYWHDSVSVVVATGARGQHVALVDVRTGAVERATDLADSNVVDLTVLPDGWAWIPGTYDRVIVQRAGKTSQAPKPAWFAALTDVMADPEGRRIAVMGIDASNDTLGVAIIPAGGGAPVMWAKTVAQSGRMDFLADGSLALVVSGSGQPATVYRVTAPGRLERLGTVPRPTSRITISRDLKHATVTTRDYQGDAWISRVVKR